MKFSDKRKLDKLTKFEKDLRTELSKWDSAHLKNYTANLFSYLNIEGTPEHFVQFILAAKFGETNSYVAIGAWVEFVIQSFNMAWKPNEDKLNEYGFRCSYNYRPSIFGHAFVDYAVEDKFSDLVGNISATEYEQAISISPNLFLDKSTNAFGFVVLPYTLSHHEVTAWRQDWMGELSNPPKANTFWRIEEPPIWKPSKEFTSGKLEYTSGFQFIFGSIETLIGHLPDLEK